MSVTSRVNLFVAEYGAIMAAAIAVLGLLAFAGAGTTYMNPPVEQVTEQTNQQSFATGVDTTAVVTNGTALYTEGQQLRNEPVYFTQASPNLTYHVWATVPEDQSVTVSQRLTLELTGARDGNVFYQSRRVFTADQTNVTDGRTWTNETVNMSSVRQLVTEKRNAMGAVGTMSVELKLSVTYQTDEYNGSLSATTPLVLSERAYWLGEDLADQDSKSSTVTRQIQQRPDMTRVWSYSALGLGLLVIAGIVLLRSRRMEPETYKTEVARKRYDEWISNGEIPTKSEKDYVRTDTLEDLVDIAIDSNGRVIYDKDLDTYAVIQGDLVYYYTTNESDLTDWLAV